MKKLGIVLVSMLISAVAFGATFNFFAPANGVLKGSSSTYVTTPAVSSDIAGLWGGTCNSSTYLRGDGTCATPPGTGGGTVNSVALTAPSVFSVSGSPITNTGTLALTFATGQTANEFLATPNGTTGAVGLRSIVAADLPSISLTSGVTSTLPFGNGGTNATSFTNHGVIIAGASSLGSLAVLGSDTLLQGNTGANPGSVSVPNCGSSTQALAYSTSTHTFSCQTISAGTGTVTSVGLTAPSVFSVSGSPVTSSGTLAVTFATGQTANQVLATPNGTTGAVGLRALTGADIPPTNLASSTNGGVTSILPTANGGTGAATLTGYVKGNGTSAFTASSTIPYSDLTGTPSIPTGANPSASVGLTAVNGSATTFMRSDAAPALDQSISPTWTGTHVFGQTAGLVTINSSTSTNASSLFLNLGGVNKARIGVEGTAGSSVIGSAVGDLFVYMSSGSFLVSNAGAAASFSVAKTSGAVTIAAPTTGNVALTTTAVSGSNAADFFSPGTGNILRTRNIASGVEISLGSISGFATIDSTNGGLSLSTQGTSNPRIQISTTGATTINAPTSGTGLTVSGSSSSTPALNVSSGTLQVGGSAGTSGQVLTSQGSGAAPIWTTGPAIATGTFSASITGGTAGNTVNFTYRIVGNVAYLVASSSGTVTSNSTSMTLTGFPSAIQPSTLSPEIPVLVFDNGLVKPGVAFLTPSISTVTFGVCSTSCSTSGFTSSGAKGISIGFAFSYPLD